VSGPPKHAKLSPSGSQRWINCPGSVRMEEPFPDDSSPYAREGTAAHEIVERALRKGVPTDTWLGTMVGVPYLDDEGEPSVEQIEVTAEMCEAAQEVVDYVRERKEELGPGTEMWLEERFDLSPLEPPAPMFGTADVVLWCPESRVLEIADYKHGQGVSVDVEGNTQLLLYALGAVVSVRKRPERIRMTIGQPRAPHHAGRIRHWEIDWAELVQFKASVFRAAEATQDEDAPLAVGDWCRWCKAAAVCPAQREFAVTTAQEEFAVIPAGEGDNPLVPPEQLTVDELAFILDRAPVVEAWFSSIRSHVTNMLDRGHPVPGYQLVPKRAQRKWVDEGAAEEALQPYLEDGAYTRKLISPAQAEKAMKGIGEELDEELWEKVSSGNKLAPSDDPRPAEIPSAQADFMAADE
jgi:hypothetical protein